MTTLKKTFGAGVTLEQLKELGKHITSEYVCADDLPGLYFQLNTRYKSDEWTLIRGPAWCGDKLVALVVRPRRDDE